MEYIKINKLTLFKDSLLFFGFIYLIKYALFLKIKENSAFKIIKNYSLK